jgi:putative ABC transport system permease protein
VKTVTLVRIATRSIARNKLRTLLTVLGVVIGVAAVIVMLAVGYGASRSIQERVNNLGTNLLVLTAGATAQGGVSQGAQTFNRLTIEDVEKIQREASLLSAVSPVVVTRSQIIGGAGNWRSMVNGVATSYAVIRDWPMASGLFFTDDDVRAMRKVVVLGNTVAVNLFPGGDAVGGQVQVRNVPFTVIGVLAVKGQTADGRDQDDVVIVPYTTARTRLSRSGFIAQILASTSSPSDVKPAQEELRAIMREAHRLGEGEPDDFTIRDQSELAETAQATTRVMTWLLAAVASISLVVGGIGIMNIMLVSVTERTHEIGIRLAIGARGSDVMRQFLVESIVLSAMGGAIGVLLGFAGAAVVGALTGWSTEVPAASVPLAVGFSATVGVFFGYYPARKAAALNPIEALRYE